MSPELLTLPRYRCHKEVRAAKIVGIALDGRSLNLDRGGPITFSDQSWMDRHQPDVGGYFVVYEDGYTSFSPAEAFEGGYTRLLELESQPSQFDQPGEADVGKQWR